MDALVDPREPPSIRLGDLRLLSLVLALALTVSWGCGDEPVAPQGGDEVSDSGGVSDSSVDGNANCRDRDFDGHGEGCAQGFDCNDDNSDVFEGAPERCDRLDNDCDGEVDEGCPCIDGSIAPCYPGPPDTLDVGRCRAGFQVCEDEVWGDCQSEILPEDEVCDLVDNDCDGAIDEGLTNACGTCGTVPEEVCGDHLDNDCDGRIDESEAGCDCEDRTHQPCYGGPPQTLGVGRCRGGTFDCIDGEWSRCRGQVLPTDEVCDGLDNDCDGLVDEGLSNQCGECGVPTPREICDDIDNDCDGLVDEGLELVCGECSNVGLEEVCGDGLDNDCDGGVDEGCPCTGDPECYPGPPESRGIGECIEGTRSCDATGEFWGECSGYVLPQPEICDGLDNNCDGLIDISPRGCDLCGRNIEECDGVDNDCDGYVDEYLRNACGECIAETVPEETCGLSCCDERDNDCDGLIDEGLVNACGTCDESCYVEAWGTSESNFSDGELNGLSDDTSEGLRLGAHPFIYPYLWVANSGAGTMTKINTQEFRAEATYNTRGSSPSRTAVDLDGNVYVANRAFEGQGSVSKFQAEDCEGDTRTNAGGCFMFNLPIGSPGDVPRGLAVDENNFAWVGTYFGRRLYQVEDIYDPDSNTHSGRLVDPSGYDVGLKVYGLAIDSESVIWISNLDTERWDEGKLGAFNIEERRSLGPWSYASTGNCSNPYGIAVDGNGHVWLGNWSCNNILEFDPDTETFTPHVPSPNTLVDVRGVAVDDVGTIWTVATSSNRLGRYDPVADSWSTFTTCSQPMGVGVTGSGTIWTPCWDSNVWYFDQLGAHLGGVTAGANPYSYSDMTGFQLRTFTARRGTWTVTFDCGWPSCTFDEVVWDGTQPVETNVSVRARSSLDGDTWSSRVGPFDSSPAELTGLPDGRYAEVELTLSTTDRDISPLITSVDLYWQRP
jgi:hypothetical protein